MDEEKRCVHCRFYDENPVNCSHCETGYGHPCLVRAGQHVHPDLLACKRFEERPEEGEDEFKWGCPRCGDQLPEPRIASTVMEAFRGMSSPWPPGQSGEWLHTQCENCHTRVLLWEGKQKGE